LDVKAYIESGILEEVVLGLSSEQEQQEVSCMSKIYPEIREELNRLEAALESYVLVHQVQPPKEMRARVLQAVADLPKDNSKDETKVISMTPPVEEKNPRMMWLAAASIALLLVSAFVFMSQRGEIQNIKDQLAGLILERDAATDSLSNSTVKIDNLNGELAILKHPANQLVTMKGVEGSPNALATIVWNRESNEVHLQVNNLTTPPEGMQYQLWAIADGVPVDMGVFDISTTDSALQKMTSMPNAQAFAVTLEIAGGVESPTLEQMVVIGNV